MNRYKKQLLQSLLKRGVPIGQKVGNHCSIIIYLLIIMLVVFTVPKLEFNEEIKKNESKKKRTDKVIMVKSWFLKKHLGPIYSKLETHFQNRRPGKNIELDANITSL